MESRLAFSHANPKIVTIIGARPQFIKAAVVYRALRERSAREVLIHTGQHFDANMSDIFFGGLDIPKPEHHLGISGGSHGQNIGRMIEAIERVLQDERPDWVLLYGDTDSTLAGALAAVKLHIPVAHVEHPRTCKCSHVRSVAIDTSLRQRGRRHRHCGCSERDDRS